MYLCSCLSEDRGNGGSVDRYTCVYVCEPGGCGRTVSQVISLLSGPYYGNEGFIWCFYVSTPDWLYDGNNTWEWGGKVLSSERGCHSRDDVQDVRSPEVSGRRMTVIEWYQAFFWYWLIWLSYVIGFLGLIIKKIDNQIIMNISFYKTFTHKSNKSD